MNPPLPPEREGSSRQSRPGEGLSTKDKAYDLTPTQHSRELRNKPTPAERKLWHCLAGRKLVGVRFNRQVVIKPYICDFVARSVKLVIELDGGQHAEAIAYDTKRTKYLEDRGYRVLRFWNNDVMNNIDGVVSKIEEALNQPPPARARSSALGSVWESDLRSTREEGRSAEGEGLSYGNRTGPPPLASGTHESNTFMGSPSRVDPSRSGGRGK